MAIRNDNQPPTTSTKGSITQTADVQTDRISNISNVSKTISNMQKDVKQRITETKKEVDTGQEISAVQSSMVKVLDKLGETVAALSKGVKSVTIDTAKATKDAIGDYGKAISSDISFNKQNIVAMALAKSTPIYGYFVAKFMETDVFKRAAERMKQSIGNAFGSLAKVFRRGAKAPGKDKNVTGKIPHMAKGGVVQKEGVAKLHAAEVVMPIDKLLDRMDETTAVSKNIGKILSKMTIATASSNKALSAMINHPDETPFGKKRKEGLTKSFFKILREEKERYKDPIEVRQLRELIAIREELGAEMKVWPEVWSRLMAKHPMFRSLAILSKGVGKMIGLVTWKPLYALGKMRGGYKTELSSSTQPLAALNENIGILYAGSMWRYDNMLNLLKAIAVATRDTASYITGKKYGALTGIGTGRWSIAGAVARVFGLIAGGSMQLAGKIPGFGGLGSLGKKLTRKSLSGEYASDYSIGGSEFGRQLGGTEKRPMFVEDVNIDNIRKPFELFYKDKTKHLAKDRKQDKLMLEYTGDQVGIMKKVRKGLKDKSWFKWIFIGFSFLKGIWNKFFGGFQKRLLTWMGIKAGGQIAGSGLLSALGFGGKKKGPVQMDLFGKKKGSLWARTKDFFGKKGPLRKGISSIFGKGGFLSKSITKLWTVGGPFLKMIGSGLKGLLMSGPFWAVIAAAGVGVGIGTLVNKYLIKPWLDKSDKAIKEAAAKTQEKLSQQGSASMSAVRNLDPRKDLEAFKEARRLKLHNIGSTAGRDKNLKGFFGEVYLSEITNAQQAYRDEHLDEYLQYDTDEIQGLRAEWLQKKKFRTRAFREDPEKYGRLREQSFLIYLKQKATPITSAAIQSKLLAYTKERRKALVPAAYKKGKELAGQALAGVQNLAKTGAEYAATLPPKARQAFEVAKQYYIKQFGWTEAQANAVLQGIASTAGDKIDKFSDVETLKKIGLGIYGKAGDMAAQARAGASQYLSTAKTMAGDISTQLSPKAKEAFQTAKKYYIKEFGWSESQADAMLQNIAATAGDKMDMFADPEKLKQMGLNWYQSTSGMRGKIQDKFSAFADTGKIVVNEAKLMLANGEFISDDLGKKIMDSGKALGEKTMQGASAMIHSVNSVTNNVSQSQTSNVGGGSRGANDSSTYFDQSVFQGNYR
jgi:uncharacterized protein with PIN domain